MTDAERVPILQEALREACRFIRTYPPGDMEAFSNREFLSALIGGNDDPEGKKYINLFLKKAVEKRRGLET